MFENFKFNKERPAKEAEVADFEEVIEDGKAVLKRISKESANEELSHNNESEFVVESENTHGLNIVKSKLSEKERKALSHALAMVAATMSPNKEEKLTPEASSEYVLRIDLPESEKWSSEKIEAVESVTSSEDFARELEEKINWLNNLEHNGEKYLDSVFLHADKPVIGSEDLTREEYVMEAIEFVHPYTKEEMPQSIQKELRHLLPGLCAQESGFNNGLTSSVGAFGIMQIMPATAIDEGYDPNKTKHSFSEQVELAGGYFAKMLGWLESEIDDDVMEELKSNHTEEELNRELIVPLLLTSYNAGAGRVAEAVNEYFAVKDNRDKNLKGRDLFIDIVDFAKESDQGLLKNFGDDARNYALKIYAASSILEARRQESEVVRLASNN